MGRGSGRGNRTESGDSHTRRLYRAVSSRLHRPEADRRIWQYRAGAIPKVRRRRARRSATATAWPRGRREAAAGGGDRTGEAAAYPAPDGGRRLRRAGGWRRAKAPQGRVRELRVRSPRYLRAAHYSSYLDGGLRRADGGAERRNGERPATAWGAAGARATASGAGGARASGG
jgi:hypothetical protein